MEIVKEKEQRRIVFMAMKDGKEIGRISLLAPLHLEHLFIEEEHRGNGVLKKLVDEAEAEAMNLGVKQVFAFAVDGVMEDYIHRLGYTKLNMTVWMKGFYA